jgi:hypothetical protein
MRIILAWLLILMILLAAAPAASAAPVVVTQCDDSGLSAALASASPGDVIRFSCGGPATIPVLTTKDLNKSLTIDGANNGHPIVVSGAAARRVFTIAAGTPVTLANMTIREGAAPTGERGGGINNAGFLTLDNVELRSNTATGGGGGVSSSGALTIRNSRVVANTYDGIYSASGSLIIQNTQVMSNTGTGLAIGSGTATISGSTFAANSTGLSNSNGTVTLRTSVVDGNTNDGAINLSGTLNVEDSSITNNTNIFTNCAALCNAYGNVGTLSVKRSVFANNVNAAGSGGASAIFAASTVTVAESLFTGNRTTGTSTGTISGQAGYGDLMVINSTFSANSNTAITNTAVLLMNKSTRTAQIANVTVVDNTGRGLMQQDGALRLANSIVAGSSGANCAGTITDVGYNLSPSGCPARVTADPRLGPLANNGGPTRTHMPGPTSPALDVIPPALCPPTDQRGVARPMPAGGNCDIGAVERQPLVYVPLARR